MKKTCTLDELLELLEPHHKKSVDLTMKAVQGLTAYATEIAASQADGWQSKVDSVKGMIEEIIPYWGMDETTGDRSTTEILLENLDTSVKKALDGAARQEDTSITLKVDTLKGLENYAIEMTVAQGAEAVDYIKNTQGLMAEIASHWNEIQPFFVPMDNRINEEIRELTEGQNMSMDM